MVQCIQSQSEMNGHGHDFGHEFLDTDTRFFWTSDTDTGSDKGMSENLGHGFGLRHDFGHDFGHGFGQSHDFGHGHGFGHGHTSDTRVRSSLISIDCFQCPFFVSNLRSVFPIYIFCLQSHNDVSNVRFMSPI